MGVPAVGGGSGTPQLRPRSPRSAQREQQRYGSDLYAGAEM